MEEPTQLVLLHIHHFSRAHFKMEEEKTQTTEAEEVEEAKEAETTEEAETKEVKE